MTTVMTGNAETSPRISQPAKACRAHPPSELVVEISSLGPKWHGTPHEPRRCASSAPSRPPRSRCDALPRCAKLAARAVHRPRRDPSVPTAPCARRFLALREHEPSRRGPSGGVSSGETSGDRTMMHRRGVGWLIARRTPRTCPCWTGHDNGATVASRSQACSRVQAERARCFVKHAFAPFCVVLLAAVSAVLCWDFAASAAQRMRRSSRRGRYGTALCVGRSECQKER